MLHSPLTPRFQPIHRSVEFAKKNTVMLIALIAAVGTILFVPIDRDYAGYFDWKTLTCLFCTLAIVCALRDVRFFYFLAQKIVGLFRTARSSVLALVGVTFLGSMLIANDMALLTFLPLGFTVLTSTGKEKYMAVTFILQNIAANLGGMLTPFGNPQNLYLYTKFSIPTSEFISILALPFAAALILLTLVCFLFVKSEPIEFHGERVQPNPPKTVLYLLLFILSVAMVFRWIPYQLGLLIIPFFILFSDRHALGEVDYPLLLTFVFFFIFAGNLGRIDGVRQFFSALLEKDPLIVSALSCQCISNVPTAILLSQFTDNYRALLLGVNIGGVGTLISSLASLITFREYLRHNPGRAGYYIALFSALNFGFLILLLLLVRLCGIA